MSSRIFTFLFLRAMSQADAKHPFDGCRENQNRHHEKKRPQMCPAAVPLRGHMKRFLYAA